VLHRRNVLNWFTTLEDYTEVLIPAACELADGAPSSSNLRSFSEFFLSSGGFGAFAGGAGGVLVVELALADAALAATGACCETGTELPLLGAVPGRAVAVAILVALMNIVP
jgi:hypothetical protein